MAAEPIIADLPRLRVAYFDKKLDHSERTIVLIHGFASTAWVNWIHTGWMDLLLENGFRVVALDNRGHGKSQKFYSRDEYGPDLFADDVLALMDHLGIERADIMGYSMGSRISAWLAAHHGERVNKVVLGGMGIHIFGQRRDNEPIALALEAEDPSSIVDPDGLAFRKFADRTRSDRLALAACIRPSKTLITEEIVGKVLASTLIAVGSDDEIAGSPEKLAALMPNATAFSMPGLDHMKATGAEPYKKRTLEFLLG